MRLPNFIVFVLISLALEAHAWPFDWLRKVSASFQTDHGWLWGWALGADSTVSVVDRFPPISFLARPASFGADLVDPLLGYVLPLNTFTVPCPGDDDDSDGDGEHDGTRSNLTLGWSSASNLGCPKLCLAGPHAPEGIESWIALVQRGKCQFVDKAREAQRLGAKGIVVGGDDPEQSGNPDALVNMYSPEDASDVGIPAVFIRYTDYMVLASLIATSNTSHSGLQTLPLLLSSEYSGWQWYSPVLTFLTILFIPSSLTFLTLLVHRIRAARAAQRERAPEDLVQRLPWRVWTGTTWEKPDSAGHTKSAVNPQDVDVELGEAPAGPPTPIPVEEEEEDPAWFLSQDECAICLEQFVRGDRVRVLPCKHIFHLEEVDIWLIHRKKVCPVCKADVTHPHSSHKHPLTPPPDNDGTLPDVHDEPPAPPTTPPPTERTPLLHQTP